MKKLRFISLLLAIIMLISVSVACSDTNDDQPETTTSSAITETTAVVEETEAVETSILDGLEVRDMKGEELNIWYSDGYGWAAYPLKNSDAGITGDIVSDAGFERNMYLEDKLGLKIVYTAAKNDPNKGESYTALRNLNLSGDSSKFDIVMTGANACSQLAINGFYRDIADSEYINAEEPYYEAQVNSQIRFHDHQFFAMGYYSVMNTAAIDVAYANIDMVEAASSYTIDDLYAMVLAKKWTVDKMLEIGKQCFTPDANTGNYENDIYSVLVSANYAKSLYYDFGGTDVDYNKQTDEYRVVLEDQKNIELLTWMQDLLSKNNGIEYVKNDGHTNAYIKGAAPFLLEMYYSRIKLIDTVSYDWAFLPIPLRNEGDDYCSFSERWNLNFAGIPTNVKDGERSEYLYDAFMRASYAYVYPAYYEQCYGIRYQRDEVGSQIFDILSTSRRLSFANIYGISSSLASMYKDGAPIASTLKGLTKGFEANLKKVENSTVNK